jgi:hypothetical protein
MGNRIKLTAWLLVFLVSIGKAQITRYQKADSISLALYQASEWQSLINFSKEAIANGEDFPLLRLRLAYAAFVRQNYSEALSQYERVLQQDQFNQVAIYYSYLSNIYLNRFEDAGFLAKRLIDKNIDGENIKPFRLITAGAESGIKFTNIYERGNSSYSRAFFNMRLGYQLGLSTSASYYSQPIHNDKIKQPGYYVRLNYVPARKINIIGAYHYMRSDLRMQKYENNTGLLGLRYADSWGDLQGDFILSQIGDEKTRQYNLKFVKFLSGNLKTYSVSRFSIMDVSEEKNMVFYQLLGFRPLANLWLEAAATIGKQYNYADADALYVYNGIDKTKFKAAGNCYFLLKGHLLLSLNYTFERKSDNIFKFNYLQHSINGGITWNF